MAERRVPISSDEKIARNKLLWWKKFGILSALCMMPIVAGGLIYVLQAEEKISDQGLYIMTGAATIILLLAIWLYSVFARKINQDMQSDEKIVTTAVVIRIMRVLKTGQRMVTLDIDGFWVTLTIVQLRRLVINVVQLNTVLLQDAFEVEMTPYGRHLMRATRI